MNIRLDGRTALVCGSSKGIGKAIALQFAEIGADVILLARSEDLLKDLLAKLPRNSGQNHSYIVGNTSKPEWLVWEVNNKIEEYGAIHILVNNSGGPPSGLASEASEEEYLSGFTNHVITSNKFVRALLPGMKQAGYGRIINIISVGLKQPIENLGVSNTIRGAMGSWAKTLSRELGIFGITVNNILPGQTDTERLMALIKLNAAREGKSIEEKIDEMKSEIPLRRFAHPEETAFAAAFLASEFASFINGISLPVDGGFLRGI